ncbi:unnamed protein product, partial [Ectocarpus fasciculatus]
PGLLSIAPVKNWVQPGRFINYQGWSIFYRDSIGDKIFEQAVPSEVASQPVVLFLHGYPTFSYDFNGLYSEFSLDGFHVIALDFLGFGVSDKPNDIDYSMHLQADIVEAVLKSVFSERRKYSDTAHTSTANEVRIIAHDMGDSVAQELLARWLESRDSTGIYSIKSVVLFNGGLFPETHKPRAAQLLLLSKATGPVASRAFTFNLFSHSFQEVFGPRSKLSFDELVVYWQSLVYKNGISSMHLLQQYMTDRVKHRERWVGALVNSSLLIPIRLINGPYDPVSGRHMVARYEQLIPESGRDVVVLGSEIGHYPQLEDPINVKKYVSDFLSTNN